MAAVSVFVIAYSGISLIFVWHSVHPDKIFFQYTPEEFGLKAEHVTFSADDGVRLSGWLIGSDTNKDRVIVLMHGYPTEKSELLPLAAALYPEFSIFLFDQRYFGASEGMYTTLGTKERKDLSRGIDFLTGKRGYSRIGVFGHSFGGAVALLTAAEDTRIVALASYGAFSDIQSVGYEKYATLGIARYPLIGAMVFWIKFLIGDIEEYSPVRAMAHIRIPVLLLHSKGDEEVPFIHAERLKKKMEGNQRAEYYFPETGRHADFSAELKDRVKHFFKKHIPHHKD